MNSENNTKLNTKNITKPNVKSNVKSNLKSNLKTNKDNGNKNTTCKKGEILKDGFVRKNGTKVAETCIKNRGAPGKGPESIKLNTNHYLSELGYENVKELSEKDRHIALEKAIKHKGHLTVIRSLIARANLNIRQDPVVYEIFKADQEWVSKKYAKVANKKIKNGNAKTKTNTKTTAQKVIKHK
jgi:hypothetical protein